MTYDSRPETKEHIFHVRENLMDVIENLTRRSDFHDASKLVEPELSAFDIATPKLANMEYGSDEYKQSLRDLGPALQHHFKKNSHHPEHYENGVNGMSLLDVIEMLCDWKAASLRTKQRADGDKYLGKKFMDSLAYNKERFNISDQLYSILVNTAKELGFDAT